jgi:hypothetical protein
MWRRAGRWPEAGQVVVNWELGVVQQFMLHHGVWVRGGSARLATVLGSGWVSLKRCVTFRAGVHETRERKPRADGVVGAFGAVGAGTREGRA